jgi:hypothetical protein
MFKSKKHNLIFLAIGIIINTGVLIAYPDRSRASLFLNGLCIVILVVGFLSEWRKKV